MGGQQRLCTPLPGVALAWDGWYFDGLDDEQRIPLATLDFDDFDDMRSKLLLKPNGAWLGGPLIYHLMPTYSLADWATHRGGAC